MDIKSMTLDELKDACQQMGEKPFRAKQLYDWMHHRLAGSYDEMTNLSLAFREKLKEQYPLTCLEKVQVQESKHMVKPFTEIPKIIVEGRKGGSNLAATLVNSVLCYNDAEQLRPGRDV